MVSFPFTTSANMALFAVLGNSTDPEFIIGKLEKMACPYFIFLPDSFSNLYLKLDRLIFSCG